MRSSPRILACTGLTAISRRSWKLKILRSEFTKNLKNNHIFEVYIRNSFSILSSILPPAGLELGIAFLATGGAERVWRVGCGKGWFWIWVVVLPAVGVQTYISKLIDKNDIIKIRFKALTSPINSCQNQMLVYCYLVHFVVG